MRALVTGGAGFIGLNLCKRLISDGLQVTCLDNFFSSSRRSAERLAEANPTQMQIVQGDVSSPHLWSGLEPHDLIYHLACPASPVHYQRDPMFTLRTAFDGTANALSASALWRVPVLLASTSEVYGDPEVSPQPESYRGRVNPVGPRSCYDEGKRAAESLAWAAFHSRTHPADPRVVRIFNTYGPGMVRNDGRMIPNFVVQAMSGTPLTVYGHGLQTRSLCYVDDTVSGLVAAMSVDRGASLPVYNIGNPDERTVLSIAEAVISACGSSSAIEHGPQPEDDPMMRRPDVSHAWASLGWRPMVSFEDGIRATVAWFGGDRP